MRVEDVLVAVVAVVVVVVVVDYGGGVDADVRESGEQGVWTAAQACRPWSRSSSAASNPDTDITGTQVARLRGDTSRFCRILP